MPGCVLVVKVYHAGLDGMVLQHCCLDLTRFNANSADLDLRISPPKVFDGSARSHTSQITRAIEPRAAC